MTLEAAWMAAVELDVLAAHAGQTMPLKVLTSELEGFAMRVVLEKNKLNHPPSTNT